MKSMRPLGWLCLWLAAPLSLMAAATNQFFPLMAWNWIPSDPSAFAQLRECGLTVAGFVSPQDLDRCQAAGLKAIVSDPRASRYDWANVDETEARRNLASLVAETGSHPAVYGYYLIDEPNARLFPGLAKVAAIVHELAPDKWAYINLFPNYASASQLGSQDYAEHLETFVSTVRPRQLSYDHYALMEDQSLRKGYWSNLESMRETARKHRLPFWNIVLTVAHFNYREPTAADLRFQVYSTLAYGGRGLAYFTYFAPKVGNYRAAPVDQFGHLTPTWHHLRNVNLQVAQLAPTLLSLHSDHVYHFGEVPEGCRPPDERSLVRQAAPDFMVGEFTHDDGRRYVMVVNRNLTTSRHCQLEFRPVAKSIRMVSPYTGELTPFSGEHLWLAPGQGVLLQVD